ncbi:kinesin-like protein KIF19 isoform X1 [Temnothorax curvispinosus]|uniref:Kinesin-like protein KIF19 isoform X1 n=1 Tax=Temnothorax curvispinosus TaxID=300111 RepID=A0A6J1Q9M2_9HYME|nr:kinesin-like protein KIF19 isoform X1 [Temnothorax curvispinosus]
MELDSHLLSLNIAAEQQHSIISHWESRNNSVYRKSRDSSTSRPGTDYQVDEIDDADLLEGDLEDDVAVQQAWTELTEITREQERYAEMRAAAEKELEACRKCSAMLEDQLPSRINSDEERELLALMLRVHELEADKMMLQTERLVKQHELRRRELMLLRYDRQRQISDEIITRQRRIMEDLVWLSHRADAFEANEHLWILHIILHCSFVLDYHIKTQYHLKSFYSFRARSGSVRVCE